MMIAKSRQAEAKPVPPPLTKNDVAALLKFAVEDIQKQDCEAMFLVERPAGIWCRCFEPRSTGDEENPVESVAVFKLYDMGNLVQKYREAKRNKKP